MKQRSLLWQVIATVLIAELLCAVILSSAALLNERATRYRAFDVMLRGRADSVVGALEDEEDTGDTLTLNRADLNLPGQDLFRISEPDGRVIGQSPQWNAALSTSRAGFQNVQVNRRTFRVLRIDSVRVLDPAQGGIRRPFTVWYATPTVHMWHSIVEAARFYIFTSLMLLAVTAAVLVWLLRRELRPLSELAEQAARVSPDSLAFAPSPEVLATSELRPLALSIEALLAGLERELAARRRFVADAAHELKTELAVIKSSLQLLQLRPRTADEYAQGLDRPLDDLDRLETLVRRMLTLGRLDESSTHAGAATALDEAARVAAERLAPLARLRGVALELDGLEPAAVAITADDAALLVSNLLSNAIEHSPQGNSVRVETVTEERGEAMLRVIDRGEGIAAEALPHVFERFFRADTSRARQTGGSGLGLAICRAIVRSAGGSLRLESKPGAGTIATAMFPGCVRPNN